MSEQQSKQRKEAVGSCPYCERRMPLKGLPQPDATKRKKSSLRTQPLRRRTQILLRLNRLDSRQQTRLGAWLSHLDPQQVYRLSYDVGLKRWSLTKLKRHPR